MGGQFRLELNEPAWLVDALYQEPIVVVAVVFSPNPHAQRVLHFLSRRAEVSHGEVQLVRSGESKRCLLTEPVTEAA